MLAIKWGTQKGTQKKSLLVLNVNKYIPPGEVKERAPRVQAGKAGMGRGDIWMACTPPQCTPSVSGHHDGRANATSHRPTFSRSGWTGATTTDDKKTLCRKGKLRPTVQGSTPSTISQVSELGKWTPNSVSSSPLSLPCAEAHTLLERVSDLPRSQSLTFIHSFTVRSPDQWARLTCSS